MEERAEAHAEASGSLAAVEMTSTRSSRARSGTSVAPENGTGIAMTENGHRSSAGALDNVSGTEATAATTTTTTTPALGVDKVSRRIQFAYGAPGFATTSLSFLISVYANDFYVAVGASLSFLSFFTALARSFDVITDPVMGWFSDRFKHPMGRRRPFILLGAPFYGLLFFLLFSPTLIMNRHSPQSVNDFPVVNPTNVTSLEAQWRFTRHGDAQHVVDSDDCATSSGSSGIAYWFGTFYTVFYLFDTLSNVPYESLGPELSDSYDERSRIFFVAKVFNFLGMMFAAGAPATGQAFYRNRHKSMESLPCDYFYNPYADGFGSVQRHGSWHPYQLIYEDAFSGVHRLAEYCNNGKGDFCFVMRLHSPDGKTHDYFFEQDPVTIANTCGGYWCNFLDEQGAEHAYFGNISAVSTVTSNGIGVTSVVSTAAQDGAAPHTLTSPSAGEPLRQYIAQHCNTGTDYRAFASNRVEFRRYSIAAVDAKIVAYQAVSAIFAIYYVVTMINLVSNHQGTGTRDGTDKRAARVEHSAHLLEPCIRSAARGVGARRPRAERARERVPVLHPVRGEAERAGREPCAQMDEVFHQHDKDAERVVHGPLGGRAAHGGHLQRALLALAEHEEGQVLGVALV